MSPRERRLLVALIVSAAVNLFLVGFVAARTFGHRPKPPGPGPFHAREMFDVGRSPEMRERFERRKEELRPQHRALREAREELEQALLAEPYDRARVEQALATLRKQTGTLQEGMHRALLDIAAELGPEERRAFVRENFGRRRGMRRGPGPDPRPR
jgi:uncharacterized membrane protein